MDSWSTLWRSMTPAQRVGERTAVTVLTLLIALSVMHGGGAATAREAAVHSRHQPVRRLLPPSVARSLVAQRRVGRVVVPTGRLARCLAGRNLFGPGEQAQRAVYRAWRRPPVRAPSS